MGLFDSGSLGSGLLSSILGNSQYNYLGNQDDYLKYLGFPQYAPPPPMYSEPNGDQSGSQPYTQRPDPYGQYGMPQQSIVSDAGSYMPSGESRSANKTPYVRNDSPLAKLIDYFSSQQGAAQPAPPPAAPAAQSFGAGASPLQFSGMIPQLPQQAPVPQLAPAPVAPNGSQPNMVVGGAGQMQVPTYPGQDSAVASSGSDLSARQQQPQKQASSPQQSSPLETLGTVLFPNTTSRLQGLQAQQAIEQAFLEKGAPPSVARAAARDPKVLAIAGPQYLGEQLKTVPYGTSLVDQHGNEVYKNDTGSQELDQRTLEAMAHQYRAGDTTVMQNLGRGQQGARNIVLLRQEITRQNAESGRSGEGQAIVNAEFQGVKSGQRVMGAKQANIDMAATEFEKVLPIVQSVSDKIDRTQYPSLNKVIQAYQQGTGDPNIVQLGSGINSLINIYARAISPNGQSTVHDKIAAREILDKAWANGQFDAAVGIMKREISAAKESPNAVRSEARQRFLGGQGPMDATSAPDAAAPQQSVIPPPPKIDQIQKGYRFKGGDPKDRNNWVKVQ
jgi:hypothetical protein